LSHISGIATKTNEFVRLAGKKTKICCTRKTIPNLRVIQKYAVKLGGGTNHRFNLSDEYLIKDNHIACSDLRSLVLKAIKNKKGGGGTSNNVWYEDDVNSASGKFGSEKAPSKNVHPTVKPIKLMKYLCRLITPKGGTVLDPFMGSGSTGMAAKEENFEFVGIEKEEEYFNIASARIESVETKSTLEGFYD